MVTQIARNRRSEIRIIGGEWRGRRLKVLPIKDLRPTPDRVRETLFNWLAPNIVGARCLDLFAGSGVLGFEALSRGASFLHMMDQSKEIIALLQEEALKFALDDKRIAITRTDLPNALVKSLKEPFNIVFVDPPYQENLLLPCCELLETQKYLESLAYIYLEAKEVIADNSLPKNWRIIKAKRAGQVYYHLAERRLPTL